MVRGVCGLLTGSRSIRAGATLILITTCPFWREWVMPSRLIRIGGRPPQPQPPMADHILHQAAVDARSGRT